jgi:hypothetical protein
MLCTLVSQWFFAHFVNLGVTDLRYIFSEFHSVCHHQLFAKSFALIDWVLLVSFPYNQQPKELRWFWNTPHVLCYGSDTLTARLRIGGYPGKRLIVVLRNLCSTVVGIGFPVYSTHKAIERKSPAEQERWLVYWAGQFSIIILPSITSWKQKSFWTMYLVASGYVEGGSGWYCVAGLVLLSSFSCIGCVPGSEFWDFSFLAKALRGLTTRHARVTGDSHKWFSSGFIESTG